jgi:hypothetical protein
MMLAINTLVILRINCIRRTKRDYHLHLEEFNSGGGTILLVGISVPSLVVIWFRAKAEDSDLSFEL